MRAQRIPSVDPAYRALTSFLVVVQRILLYFQMREKALNIAPYEGHEFSARVSVAI